MFKQLGYAKRAKKALDTAIQLNPKNMDALYGLMLSTTRAQFHRRGPTEGA